MKTKDYIGKRFLTEMIPEELLTWLPDDYECPCWRMVIPDDRLEVTEACFYYAEIMVDEDDVIKSIKRNKDIYVTNYVQTRFPLMVEERFEELMNAATESI